MLIDRIRTSLAKIHDAIEVTPIAKSLITGAVTREQYHWVLIQLEKLHSELEKALKVCQISVYREKEMSRAGVIANDITALQFEGDYEIHPALEQFASYFEQWILLTPWKLIGALYVVEGSRMGSMALVRPIAKALGIDVKPGKGVDYHLDGIASRPQAWGQFKASLASQSFTPDQEDDICHAAVETMTMLHSLYSTHVISQKLEMAHA